jgi:PAS domain S-box-containing protein
VLRAGEGTGAATAVGTRIPDTARPVGDAVQSAAPVTVSSASGDVGGDPVLRGADHQAWIGVPLIGEGGLYGVLAVYSLAPREWRPEEVQALEALAGSASSALANAQLYHRVAIEKERLDAVLESIADGIVAVDRDGAVVLWNAAAERITDVPVSEALGRAPDDILQRSLAGEQQGGGERLLSIMRGGEEVWLSLTEAVMRDPTGAISGRVYAFRDVSTERSVEQLKSDFVASVSHELRAPLTSIFGFAETLLGREGMFGEDERRTFLHYIASEAERLTNIVEQLLNVARLEAGDLEVAIETVDVRPVVRDAVAQAERLTGGADQEFAVELPPAPLYARADGDKLRQVVANLLDNAVKYSPDRGTIVLEARRRADRVEVEIADDGPGIPQAEHELIFRKFYRALDPLSETRGGPGAGLGLFIARGLIGAMGGRIWVASVEGEGSRFGFELPLATPGERGDEAA